jgi:hypothetical protein
MTKLRASFRNFAKGPKKRKKKHVKAGPSTAGLCDVIWFVYVRQAEAYPARLINNKQLFSCVCHKSHLFLHDNLILDSQSPWSLEQGMGARNAGQHCQSIEHIDL